MDSRPLAALGQAGRAEAPERPYCTFNKINYSYANIINRRCSYSKRIA